MRFVRLTIQGFRSFQSEETLHFPPVEAGFFLLTGENRLEPGLGANGAGKSSIWDALCWGLYGKTPRGLRAGAISNWEGSSLTSVVLEMEEGGESFLLTRTWSPNSLILQRGEGDPQKITQEIIDDLMGMDYPTFLNSILMGQFGRFFFDLTPAEKLSVFSDALDLQIWIDAAQEARRSVGAIRDGIAAQRSDLSADLGMLREKENRLSEALQKAKDLEAQKGERIRSLQAEQEALEQKRVKYISRQQLWSTRVEMSRGRIKMLRDRLIKADDQARAYELEIRDLSSQIKASIRSLKEISLRRKKAKAAGTKGICPYCDREFSGDSLQIVLDRMDLEHEWERAEKVRLKERRAKIRKKLAGREERKLDLDRKLNIAERKEASRQAKHREARASLMKVETKLEYLRRSIHENASGGNPHQELADLLKGEIKELQAEIGRLELEIQEAENILKTHEFWVGGFKDVRLWVVEQALAQLEVEVNNGLIQLGLRDWEVRFDAEREGATGSLIKGFSVQIVAPGSSEAVPWEAWSGGETQRLRIAGAIGLSNLLLGRRGIRPSLEVWDEPTAHLSQEGIDDLLRFFEARSRELNRQIWLVDHRSLDFGGFDEQVVVVKDHSGSHIEQRKY
jgi:DNA repair exonuclease SbcCD ATPase subunit